MKQPLMSSWPPGGLLADEMGLGKTVEVLSCVLLHPRTSLPRPQKRSFSCDQEVGSRSVMIYQTTDLLQLFAIINANGIVISIHISRYL